MKKSIITIFILFFNLTAVFAYGANIDRKSCSLNGINLYGTVKVIEYGIPDFTVKSLEYGIADLTVKRLEYGIPTGCGEWKFIEYGIPDFTIKFIEYGIPDFTVKFTNYGMPGVN